MQNAGKAHNTSNKGVVDAVNEYLGNEFVGPRPKSTDESWKEFAEGHFNAIGAEDGVWWPNMSETSCGLSDLT